MKNDITASKRGRAAVCLAAAVLILAGEFLLPLSEGSGATAGRHAFAASKAPKRKIKGRVNALSYKMKLRLVPKKDRLYETVTIRFRNATNRNLRRIYLRSMAAPALKYAKKEYASPANSRKKCRFGHVTRTGTKIRLFRKFSKDRSVIRVTLDRKLAPGEKGSVTVRMWTDIPARQDRFGVHRTKRGKLYLLSFCFPYLADNRNGKWYLDPFFDDGESRKFDLAKYDVTFRAPKKYRVAMTGLRSKKGGVSKAKTGSIRDYAIAACKFMRRETFRAGGVKFNSYYLLNKHSRKYRKIVKMAARDSVRAFNKNIGKCPVKEITIVHALFGFMFGGMEYPGFIMVNGSSFFDDGNPKYGWIGAAEGVAHEIGHQWFYAAVGNREYREGWIDEGFTTFATNEFYVGKKMASMRYAHKKEGMRYSLKQFRKNRAADLRYAQKSKKKTYVNIPPNRYGKDQSYGDAEYYNGDLFLQELRQVMGKKTFRKFFRGYYRRFYRKRATTKRILRYIRKYAPGPKARRVIRRYINMKYVK